MSAVRGVPRVAPLPRVAYEALVRAALAEDFGLGGDVTSDATIDSGTRARGGLVARVPGVLAGIDAALLPFALLDPTAACVACLRDGDAFDAGAILATIDADARALLGAERTSLNLLSHLCGIATETARYVRELGDARCVVTETRKTLPGLRALEKYAVRTGGGANHRLRLDDAILIKDNHVALAGGVTAALTRARARAGHLVKVEIEVDTLAQLDEALASPAAPDAILLDNFSLGETREAVRRIAGRAIVEASGSLRLADVAAVAAAGVDVISVGALTHSVTALDIGLDIVI